MHVLKLLFVRGDVLEGGLAESHVITPASDEGPADRYRRRSGRSIKHVHELFEAGKVVDAAIGEV